MKLTRTKRQQWIIFSQTSWTEVRVWTHPCQCAMIYCKTTDWDHFWTLNLTADILSERQQHPTQVPSDSLTTRSYQPVRGLGPVHALSLPIQAHVSLVCWRLVSRGRVSPRAASHSVGNVESCSVLHTREEQTQQESKRVRLTAEQTQERLGESWRVTSLTGAETVTGDIFRVFVLSLFLPPLSKRMLCCK